MRFIHNSQTNHDKTGKYNIQDPLRIDPQQIKDNKNVVQTRNHN